MFYAILVVTLDEKPVVAGLIEPIASKHQLETHCSTSIRANAIEKALSICGTATPACGAAAPKAALTAPKAALTAPNGAV
ncbi:hypothetical protein L484_016567 [Morus notabilis]|uniref:Uncharacterized protein n=1 Tax=Morus notabilis TaxID=981085 RepID=W9QK92_9ROSA|nr:hypothetical protein L484_016567 [Morus notabilis]